MLNLVFILGVLMFYFRSQTLYNMVSLNLLYGANIALYLFLFNKKIFYSFVLERKSLHKQGGAEGEGENLRQTLL